MEALHAIRQPREATVDRSRSTPASVPPQRRGWGIDPEHIDVLSQSLGQLVIGAKKTWEQGELIPDVESSEPRTTGTLRRPPPYPFGSPVTS